jgi:hypothetical protein
MDKIKRIVATAAVSCLGAILCGCNAPARQQQHPMAAANAPAGGGSASTARRFQDTPLEGRTAVESAIELSENTPASRTRLSHCGRRISVWRRTTRPSCSRSRHSKRN